ncbi:hypothetical protein BDQ12DRAFT_668458 [Crucibulum laeve]|uniref:CCHC-type domain-containing protein n=1 Tax=Crucibulum laeve TaxID=68775 RepID=A0A5C3LUD5_9AGAR|nr:hypothetical protein BDQ12DRAFT_668458 [Crucibulum laeve]
MEEQVYNGKIPGQTWGRFASKDDPQPYKPKTNDKTSNQVAGLSKQPQNNKYTNNNGQNQSQLNKQPAKEKTNKLTKEEYDHPQAEGCCFTCKEVGHESCNCSSHHQAKAPVINASSVHIAESYYPNKEAFEHGILPSEQFMVMPYGDSYEVTDWTDIMETILCRNASTKAQCILEEEWLKLNGEPEPELGPVTELPTLENQSRQSMQRQNQMMGLYAVTDVFKNKHRQKCKGIKILPDMVDAVECTAMKLKDFC